MPLVKSSFKPSPFFLNGHIATIYSNFFRKRKVRYVRKRIGTPDQDFFDIDVISCDSNRLIIALHGLEGDTYSSYMTRLASVADQHGFDFMGINHRGCSGEPNRLFSSYHSGWTQDLSLILERYSEYYEQLFLVGFSLGGNIMLKHIGEHGEALNPKIKAGVAVSTPVDLKGCANEMRKHKNLLYMRRFLKSLKAKTIEKSKRFPDEVNVADINGCQSFFDYDDLYTAPAHGFESAEDYWAKSSSLQFLDKITIPSLLINAQDDPFLSDSCYPVKIAEQSDYFYLETPKHGGHVGFIGRKKHWLEQRIISFFENPGS